MKFEPEKVSKIIEQNYSFLAPAFLEMQTEYLASLNAIYHDLDASLVAMIMTSQLYKNTINESNSKDKISLKYFYQKENFKLPISAFKIIKISHILNLPRETTRRKKQKLINDELIIIDKKNKMFSLNTDMVEEKIIKLQIDNLSRFLSKFYFFFNRQKIFTKDISIDLIKKDVEQKFLIYFIKFLDFQISYFSKMKSILDIESIFIVLLCALNTTAQLKQKNEPMNPKAFFDKIQMINKTLGLNATSISEITKVPRTTVLRKIAYLEKIGMIKKDKYKRYLFNDIYKVENSKKIEELMDNNIKLLGGFFSECLETYGVKQLIN